MVRLRTVSRHVSPKMLKSERQSFSGHTQTESETQKPLGQSSGRSSDVLELRTSRHKPLNSREVSLLGQGLNVVEA
ncbi:hypothetical protein RRG08_058052 [Elysia crispata]|uniref:Uncharacterized protein n=1 Tax=Elysia crispata TaxID=231223 RepID=A0AAE1A7Z1_9GAST|nr:hypothetical protein RRG08_058052 [Elysia crispata]